MKPNPKHTQLSESELIVRAKSDQRYFGTLYEMHFETIFRFIFKRVNGNDAVCGDLTQQSFIKAMVNLQKYEDRGLPFRAWLFRIAQNEINMFFRAQQKNYSVDVSDNQLSAILDETFPSENYTQDDLDKLVHFLNNNLEESQLDLIELRFFQQMSFREIADIYQLTEANTKMRIYRILEKIKQNWNK